MQTQIYRRDAEYAEKSHGNSMRNVVPFSFVLSTEILPP